MIEGKLFIVHWSGQRLLYRSGHGTDIASRILNVSPKFSTTWMSKVVSFSFYNKLIHVCTKNYCKTATESIQVAPLGHTCVFADVTNVINKFK